MALRSPVAVTRILGCVWVFPLLAAVVAFVFAWQLGRRYLPRRDGFYLLWTISLVMYGAASIAVTIGVASGWSESVFAVYWVLGAVLNVPFLAAGELVLLVRAAWVRWAVWLLLVFVSAYTVSVVVAAAVDPGALAERLPSGKDVFGDGTPAHRLPQLISIPSYLVLVIGTGWSAWRMRGRSDLRDRFVGTLLVAAGATIIAGFGSAFAALGNAPAFSASLLAGIAVIFWGFLRATKTVPVPDGEPVPDVPVG